MTASMVAQTRIIEPLFEPLQIGSGWRMRNRLALAPMSVGYGDENGYVTRAMVEHYGRRAAGGVGMVITENLAINEVGRQMSRQAMIGDERFLEGLSELALAIKTHGALAVAQIVHAGRYAGPWEQYEARSRLAPSAVPFRLLPGRTVTPQEITHEQIDEAVGAFARAAALARRAGFDGVEIHGGQGFLISSFQSRRMNVREDAYGGSFENRCRFALQVVDAVTAAAGDHLMVGYHLMADELMPDGWSLPDATRFALELAPRGVTFVMPMTSTFESLRAPHNEGLFGRHRFQHAAAAHLSRRLTLPVVTNGNLGDPREAAAVLSEDPVAIVALARPLMADPDWPLKVQSGRFNEIRTCPCNPPLCLHTQLTGSLCQAWPDSVKETGYLGYAA